MKNKNEGKCEKILCYCRICTFLFLMSRCTLSDYLKPLFQTIHPLFLEQKCHAPNPQGYSQELWGAPEVVLSVSCLSPSNSPLCINSRTKSECNLKALYHLVREASLHCICNLQVWTSLEYQTTHILQKCRD